MPPPDPMEIALGEIGMELYNEYDKDYKPMNEKLLSKASVDRSNQAAGRSSVDAQIATSNQISDSIMRGASTGGFGGAGSISLVDAGATGAAVEGAGAAGYGAGKQNYVQKLGGAVGAINEGQDVSIQGMRNVAGISSKQALDDYNHTQAMQKIKSDGLAQIASSAASAYNFRKADMRAEDIANAQTKQSGIGRTNTGFQWKFTSPPNPWNGLPTTRSA